MHSRSGFLCLLVICAFANINAQDGYYSYTLSNFRESKLFNETIDLEHPDSSRLNAVLFYLTNETRLREGLKEVAYHPKLGECAQLHSNSMVADQFFDHINPKTKKLREPIDRAHYVGITNPFLAENIIEGFLLQYKEDEPVYYGGPGIFRYHPEDDPIKAHTFLSLGENLMERWMSSPNHRGNILSPKAVQMGCGTTFFVKEDFYGMPALVATQNFQFYETLQVEK